MFSTFQVFITNRYILNDLRNHKNIFNFVFQIMRHAKKVNINDFHEQLIWVYNAIAFELVRNVNSSKEITFVINFINKLENKKKTWFRIYFRKYDFGYKAEIGDQQNSNYSRRSEYQQTYKPQQDTSYLFSFAQRRFFQFSKKNVSEKNFSSLIQQNVEKNRKDKVPTITFSWRDRLPLKDFNTGERNFDFQKNRDGYSCYDRPQEYLRILV